MKPRTRIRHMSKSRATQNQLYTKLKVKFLDEHPFCVRCCDTIAPRYRTVHHFYGRVGALLCWVPGFRMACMSCHRFIETHRNESVKLGLRAPDNLFNRPSLVIPK